MIKTRLEIFTPTKEEKELMLNVGMEIAKKLDELPRKEMSIHIIANLMKAMEEMTGVDWLTLYIYFKANCIDVDGK